jgi:CRP-like cAMP-binding protein
MISIELLRKQRLLQRLDESVVIDLARHMRFEQFQKRDYVFHKGSSGDALIMVLSGRLQIVTLSEDNREVGLSFVEAGDYCGELSIIDGGARSASAVAVVDSMVGFLPRAKARWLFFTAAFIAQHEPLLLTYLRGADEYRKKTVECTTRY